MAIVIDDISVKIIDRYADKLSVSSQYVCYHVQLPAGGIIYRRFREFVWLRDTMREELPGAILPLLPLERGGSGNVNPSFVNERKAGLASFLNLLLNHEYFAEAECFKMFLTGPDLDASVNELVAKQLKSTNEDDETSARIIKDKDIANMKTKDAQMSEKGWSRYTMDDKPAPIQQTSWFDRLSSTIQSFSAAKPPPYKHTLDDEDMASMLKTVHELLSRTNVSLNSAKWVTEARLSVCGSSIEWAGSLVADPTKARASRENQTRSTQPSQAPSMEGVCRGLSGRMLYFGEMSQRGIGATAQQENKLLAKLLTERIEMLAATRHALAAREKVLKELIHARAASFHCGEAVNRARSAEGKDREKLQADLESTQKSHYLAQAVVLRLDKKLKVATTRLKGEWIRINDEWVALFKASLLEVAFANQRMHQMQYASLSTMRADLEEEGHREHDLSQEFTPSLAATEVAHLGHSGGNERDSQALVREQDSAITEHHGENPQHSLYSAESTGEVIHHSSDDLGLEEVAI